MKEKIIYTIICLMVGIFLGSDPIFVQYKKMTTSIPVEKTTYEYGEDSSVTVITEEPAFEILIIAQTDYTRNADIIGLVYDTSGFFRWEDSHTLTVLSRNEFDSLVEESIQICMPKSFSFNSAGELVNGYLNKDLTEKLEDISDSEQERALINKYQNMLLPTEE